MDRKLGGLIVGTLLFPALASASEAGSLEECKAYSDLAATMMEARQKGMPMSKAMDPDGDGTLVEEPFMSMVVLAYEEPHFATERMQQRAITDFQNRIHLMCVKDRRK